MVVLVVGLDRDTIRGASGRERGRRDGLVGREELNKDSVRGAAGRERGGWDGWQHGGAAGGESRAEYIRTRCVVLLDVREVVGLDGGCWRGRGGRTTCWKWRRTD